MDTKLNMQKSMNEEIQMHQNNAQEEIEQNRYNQEEFREPISKKNLFKERDAAIAKLREALSFQSEYSVRITDTNISTGNEHVEKMEELNNELDNLEKHDMELQELNNKYKVKAENDDVAGNIASDIVNVYVTNVYGNLQEQIKDIKQKQEDVKQQIQNETRTLEEKVKQYKNNILQSFNSRKERVNDEFARNKNAKSSKNKKKKGRDKGLGLADSVIGATEETYAMNYDMQHRKKKIDSWYKKAPKIKDKDIELNGNEFELVFKNKSGSAIDIKSVMEKIAKLDIKSMNEENAEEKKKYEQKRDVLKKTLKIICAANGIDSETGTYFVQETDEEKAEVQKKVDYANSVYNDAIREYQQAVELMKTGDYLEKTNSNPGFKEINYEPATLEYKKNRDAQSDRSGFDSSMSRLKNDVNKNFPQDIFDSAKNMCKSHDVSLYQGENTLEKRKEDVIKETKFITDLLKGNFTEVIQYTMNKLNELEEKGIKIEDALNPNLIVKRPKEYEELAPVIKLLKYAGEKAAGNPDFERAFADNKMKVYKKIAQVSAIDNYDAYLKEVRIQSEKLKKAKIDNNNNSQPEEKKQIAFEEYLSKRKSKLYDFAIANMKKKLSLITRNFDKKWTEEKLTNVKYSDLCEYEKNLEMQLNSAEMQSVYSEEMQELKEVLEEQKQKYNDIRAQRAEIELSDKVRKYIQANYALQGIQQRLNNINNRLREEKESVLEKKKSFDMDVMKENKNVKTKDVEAVVERIKVCNSNYKAAKKNADRLNDNLNKGLNIAELEKCRLDPVLEKRINGYIKELYDKVPQDKVIEIQSREKIIFEFEQSFKDAEIKLSKNEITQEEYETAKENLALVQAKFLGEILGFKDGTEYDQAINELREKIQKEIDSYNELSRESKESVEKDIEDSRESKEIPFSVLIQHIDAAMLDEISAYNNVVTLLENENAEKILEENKKEIIRLFEEFDLDKSEMNIKDSATLEYYRTLKEAIESGTNLDEELMFKCFAIMSPDEKKLTKINNIESKMKEEIINTENLIKEQLEQYDEKHNEQAQKEEYDNMLNNLNKIFGMNKEDMKFNRAVAGLSGTVADNINDYALRVDKFQELKAEELAKKRQGDNNTPVFTGITKNTLAIQNFLIDTSEDKYVDVEKRYREKKKFKEDEYYTLIEEDFKPTYFMEGFANVDFETLMFKRKKLIEWIESNQDKKDENKYKEKNEVLEKLNNFLKTYSIANGVDFETGELLCEMADATEESIKATVHKASLNLTDVTNDIENSYFPEEEYELDNDLVQIEIAEEEKGGVELESGKKMKFLNLYSKSFKKENSAFEASAKTKRGGFSAEAKIKKRNLKKFGAIAAGIGTVQDKEKVNKSLSIGAQAKIGFSYSAFNASFETAYEKELLGLKNGVKAEGSVDIGTASASAEVKACIFDENGTFNPTIQTSAGAELALLKLEAAVGAKLMGVGIDAQLGFMVGVAAKLNLSFENWKLKFDIGACMGFGFNASITLDFGDVVEKITGLAKKASVKVVDYVKDKLCMWGFGKKDRWYSLMIQDIEKLDAILSENDRKELNEQDQKNKDKKQGGNAKPATGMA